MRTCDAILIFDIHVSFGKDGPKNKKPPGKIPGGLSRQRRSAQKPLTFNRPPVTVFPLREAVATVLERMASLIVAADAPECDAAYNAAAPVTCGVAIEVPLYDPYVDAPFFPGSVE